MPIFGSRKEPSPEPVVEYEDSRKKSGLFHRNRSPTGNASSVSSMSTRSHHTAHEVPDRHGSKLSRNSGGGGGLTGGLFGKRHHDNVDPSVLAARERVEEAEAAEMEADRALEAARLRVREAKAHVRRIEEEAAEESRRAQLKQQQANEIGKRGKGLGRELLPLRRSQVDL